MVSPSLVGLPTVISAMTNYRSNKMVYLVLLAIILIACAIYAYDCLCYNKDLEMDYKKESGLTWKETEERK